MKNIGIFLLTVILVFSIAACGEKPVEEPETSPEVLAFVEMISDAAAEQGTNDILSCKLTAKGNSVVYQYTYKNIPEFSEEQKAKLDEGLAEAEEMALEAFKLLKAEVPEVGSLIYEYYETDGDFITSKEYK